jgi:hypothetical protein
MAARDLAVADVAARSALGGTHASSGSFKREAEAEAKGGTHASSGSFKREADAKGGTHSSGGSFKRLASGGTHASGGIFWFQHHWLMKSGDDENFLYSTFFDEVWHNQSEVRTRQERPCMGVAFHQITAYDATWDMQVLGAW